MATNAQKKHVLTTNEINFAPNANSTELNTLIEDNNLLEALATYVSTTTTDNSLSETAGSDDFDSSKYTNGQVILIEDEDVEDIRLVKTVELSEPDSDFAQGMHTPGHFRTYSALNIVFNSFIAKFDKMFDKDKIGQLLLTIDLEESQSRGFWVAELSRPVSLKRLSQIDRRKFTKGMLSVSNIKENAKLFQNEGLVKVLLQEA